MSSEDRPAPGDGHPDRRAFLQISLGTIAASLVPPSVLRASSLHPRVGFAPLPPSTLDKVVVPEGHVAEVLLPWGHPLADDVPAWHPDNTAADQRRQAGMHHDGIAFFPAHEEGEDGRLVARSDHGWLCINHEYVDNGLLFADGARTWNLAKVHKAQAAVGVSVVEVRRDADMRWHVVGGHRIHADTRVEITGPARGIACMRTAGDLWTPGERAGNEVRGTLANCGCGQTPWGTYLTCEENFQSYFRRTYRQRNAREARYGIGGWPAPPTGNGYGWELDPRFDADIPDCRNHPHRFGWVVEIDPSGRRPPKKRTALGRCRHEAATVVIDADGHAVVYTGDDARGEYVYRFRSARPWTPGDVEANDTLLDEGTLSVARFDGTRVGDVDGHPTYAGAWIPLTMDHPKLAAAFSNQGEICTFARQAADIVGATPMDRPEWGAVRRQYPADHAPRSAKPTRGPGWVYMSMTNNTLRRSEQEDTANPRANNAFGQIVRWLDDPDEPGSNAFCWQHAVLCGNRDHPEVEHRGNVEDGGAAARQDFGSPDGLWIDGRDVLWVQTDVSSSTIDAGVYRGLGNNQILAVDPETRIARRFLVGPRRCEVTGMAETPDGRTFFVNIQHPGEPSSGTSNPDAPLSNWPPNEHGRPRSATIVIRRRDPTDPRPIGQ